MFPCPKCTSLGTYPSSDKGWADAVLRVIHFHGMRCRFCFHRFHAFVTPGEWRAFREGLRLRYSQRASVS